MCVCVCVCVCVYIIFAVKINDGEAPRQNEQ